MNLQSESIDVVADYPFVFTDEPICVGVTARGSMADELQFSIVREPAEKEFQFDV